jgi:hypothetical protein
MDKKELSRRVALENFNTEMANAEIKIVKEHFSKFIGKKVILADGSQAKASKYRSGHIMTTNGENVSYEFSYQITFNRHTLYLGHRSRLMGSENGESFCIYLDYSKREIGEVGNCHLNSIAEDWYPELMDVDTIFNAAQKAKEIAEEYKKEVAKVPYQLRAWFYLENLR